MYNKSSSQGHHGLRVAVLGAVLNARFAAPIPVAASSLRAAPAAAHGESERRNVLDAFSSGLQTSQLVGASAVVLGGVLAAVLLHRAQREDARTESDAVAA
ncbi:hypothetical protein ACF1AX_23380 [Streptomyces sp. NPDC014802]|uniref:hypothetical protein n=1 Tax=Streptomyces sp. NPDC014802 TaxID=3364917 RepID=UPI0036F8E632